MGHHLLVFTVFNIHGREECGKLSTLFLFIIVLGKPSLTGTERLYWSITDCFCGFYNYDVWENQTIIAYIQQSKNMVLYGIIGKIN